MRGDIRKLMAVLRVPRLCTEFHRAVKKKLDIEENSKAELEAFRLLTASNGGESERTFMEGFINEIKNKYHQLKLQKQDTNEIG